ncbi:MAG TPA: NAD(P)-dependent oxidoreductase [Dyella sp.]|uniref:NAD(P)-dependent oxidoreductase n=1 Tax=Dyella sp. TaxID=1869338 RepID=UPI002F95F166
MNIAILGASGNVGSRLVAEALSRGHRVTAVARNANAAADTAQLRHIAAAVGDPSLADRLAGHDAIVSAIHFTQAGPEALLMLVRKSGVKRYLVVGGAGSLEIAPGKALVDTPDFPAAYAEEAQAGKAFLGALRGADDLNWTFLSPSALLVAGERTGKFRLGGDELLVDAHGKSWISMEDYAVAMLDEVERPAHERKRFTVGY